MLVQRDNKVSKDELARGDNACVRSGLEENGEKVISILQREEYCLNITLTPEHILDVYPFHLLHTFVLRNGWVTSYGEGEMELYIIQDVRLLGAELWPSEVGVTDPISTSIYTQGQIATCVYGSPATHAQRSGGKRRVGDTPKFMVQIGSSSTTA